MKKARNVNLRFSLRVRSLGDKAVKADILVNKRKVFTTKEYPQAETLLISIDKFLANSKMVVTDLTVSTPVVSREGKESLLYRQLEIMHQTLSFLNTQFSKSK